MYRKSQRFEVQQCVHCKLDCKLETDEFDNNGVLIIVTKWLELGSAAGLVQHSCDSLAKNPFFPMTGPGWCGVANPSNEPGKVRLSFETEHGRLLQQELVLQNRSYLKEERYNPAVAIVGQARLLALILLALIGVGTSAVRIHGLVYTWQVVRQELSLIRRISVCCT